MKRRKSTKAVSIAVTIAMMMSLGGYVFADEVEETEEVTDVAFDDELADSEETELVEEEEVIFEETEEYDYVIDSDEIDETEIPEESDELFEEFEEFEIYEEVVEESYTFEDDVDNDYLAEQFIMSEMSVGYQVNYSTYNYTDIFSPEGLIVYDLLAGKVQNIAGGVETNTIVEIPNSTLALSYTASDLGLANLKDSAAIRDALLEHLPFSVQDIMNTLMNAYPYEMYWFDKTSGLQFSYSYSNNGTTITITKLTFKFSVAQEYQAGDKYTMNTTYGTAVRTAAANARSIIDTYAGLSDYDKLLCYNNQICLLTDYNHDAAGGGAAYGNPWQLVWVFDGDPTTTVVCEGYSKAFQYLCDNTVFRSNAVYAISVSGTAYFRYNSGPHMWNVVHMDDGLNYMVDVTNSDPGGEGNTGSSLFLIGASSGNVNSGYTFSNGYRYVYDDDTHTYFSASALTLTSVSYVPPVEGLEISEENFPDANFRSFISENYDSDGNGGLSDEEIAAVTQMSVMREGISDLSGLEYFTSLLMLNCEYNNLTSIDISNCPSLVYLDCGENPVTTLNYADSLLYLDIHSTYISDVEISSSLLFFACFNSNITSIDLTDNEYLLRAVNEGTRSEETSPRAYVSYSYVDSGTPNPLPGLGGSATYAVYCDSTTTIITGEPSYNPGWNEIDGKYYYADEDGNLVYGWLTLGSNKYYLGEDGARVTGWQEMEGNYYYFKTNGTMITGWKTLSGKTYYFDANGVMLTGWQDIDGTRYYFKSSGAMITGWKTWGSKSYYFGNDGAMRTGWQEIEGSTYYFKTNGTMITGWKTWGSKTYYFGNDGAMRTGWQEIEGSTYYFKTSGVMVMGWKVLSGKTYYFDPVTGAMQTGLMTIDGKIYYFKTNGTMIVNTSRTLDGVVYEFGSDGACINL